MAIQVGKILANENTTMNSGLTADGAIQISRASSITHEVRARKPQFNYANFSGIRTELNGSCRHGRGTFTEAMSFFERNRCSRGFNEKLQRCRFETHAIARRERLALNEASDLEARTIQLTAIMTVAMIMFDGEPSFELNSACNASEW